MDSRSTLHSQAMHSGVTNRQYFSGLMLYEGPQMRWSALQINIMQPEYSEESILNKIQPFTIQLEPDQSACIQIIMPKKYSLQEVRKPAKKNRKDHDGKANEQAGSLTNLLPRSSRLIGGSNLDGSQSNIKTKRSRPKKVQDYPDDDVPKRKVKHPTLKSISPFGQVGLPEQEISQCMSIMSHLKKNPNVGPFLQPVNPIELKIPDYFQIVSHPMDISTMERKLKTRTYQTFKQFKDDLTLIWMNSYKYNQKGSDIYHMTSEMDKLATKLIASRSTLPPSTNSISNNVLFNNSIAQPQVRPKKPVQPRQPMSRPTVSKQSVLKVKKARSPSTSKIAPQKHRPMTIYQKRKLCQQIKLLPKQHLTGVWRIVSQNNDSPDLTFDIDKLGLSQLWQLNAYIQQKKDKPEQPDQPITTEQKSEDSSSFIVESESDK